ncbi:MAG: energy transducer TonB, partial [Candidatus Eremiobacteraeota bacterium]|nr:energy transducer TonB [Candidatus Eremiobacteraeota bacterium]
LRALIATLRDSHTAVYSPDDLQPPRERSRRAVLGMSPDYVASGAAIDWHRMKGGIGYLRIASFPDSLTGVLEWALSDIGRDPAMILDLRGNPGGLVDSVDEVAGVFLPPGTLISSGTRRYHLFGPQQFTANDAAGATYQGRLVVLIDRDSRSGAESLARALQYYHRATLVGTRTAGKVLGVDAEISLDDGGLLRVATLDMRDPSGQRLEGKGVQPDMVINDPRRQYAAALALLDEAPVDASPEPAPAPCPVGVNGFFDDAVGKPNGYEQYAVGLTAMADPVSVTLAVQGATATQPVSVAVSRLVRGDSTFVFPWPWRDLTAIGVRDVVDLNTGAKIDCNPPRFMPEGRSSDEDKYPSKGFYTLTHDPRYKPQAEAFDDSNVRFSNSVTALRLQESDFVNRVGVQYPEMAKEAAAQGCAVVDVAIGAGGKLVAAKIVKPACDIVTCSQLNDAALRAAHASTYKEPQVGGAPVVRDYLIDYCWFLR